MSENIKITRVNVYSDSRFNKKVLNQHGAFTVNDKYLYEVEIFNENSARISGSKKKYYKDLIKEFRFFAEHITNFFDASGKKILEYKPINIFKVDIDKIQPSQFYVSNDKKQAIKSFVETEKDIIIPLTPLKDKYISLDGHTRLLVAIDLGFEYVYGFVTETSEHIFDFVTEAKAKNINNVRDIEVLDHKDYIEKWIGYCDEYWSKIDLKND